MTTSRAKRPTSAARSGHRLVACWFAADVLVALAPPLYWEAAGRTVPILGVPAALAYFLAVDVCIVASILFAWLFDRRSAERPA